MVALASARAFGMLLNGGPNVFVLSLLVAEAAMALWALSALRHLARGQASGFRSSDPHHATSNAAVQETEVFKVNDVDDSGKESEDSA